MHTIYNQNNNKSIIIHPLTIDVAKHLKNLNIIFKFFFINYHSPLLILNKFRIDIKYFLFKIEIITTWCKQT